MAVTVLYAMYVESVHIIDTKSIPLAISVDVISQQ